MAQRAALVIVGCAVAALAVGCGHQSTTSLSSLVERQEHYDGQTVTASGHVRSFQDQGGTYYVLEDEQDHRVVLLPTSFVAPYAGALVQVTGCFQAGPSQGRSITLTSIAPTGGEAPGGERRLADGCHALLPSGPNALGSGTAQSMVGPRLAA